jgi:hypothetical protein
MLLPLPAMAVVGAGSIAPDTKLAEIWPSGRAGALPMKEGTCVASTAAMLANMTVRKSMETEILPV